MPVTKIDEQRRQEEADRANRLYDLPMADDGPRFDEPVMDRFAPEIADDIAVINLKGGRRRADRSGAHSGTDGAVPGRGAGRLPDSGVYLDA
jgi:hypothetical protein